jgi:hypothetical protein
MEFFCSPDKKNPGGHKFTEDREAEIFWREG